MLQKKAMAAGGIVPPTGYSSLAYSCRFCFWLWRRPIFSNQWNEWLLVERGRFLRSTYRNYRSTAVCYPVTGLFPASLRYSGSAMSEANLSEKYSQSIILTPIFGAARTVAVIVGLQQAFTASCLHSPSVNQC